MNLFFILVLIIMAFGTIFDIDKYSWKKMLVPFLFAALLINFSLAIGQYIISIGDGLSRVFLTTLGTTDLKTRIMQGLSLQKLEANKGTGITGTALANIASIYLGVYQQIIAIVFFIIFGAIALIAMISAFIFVLIRIPVLWMFLIVSPVAWFGLALPNLRAQTWSPWWKNFLQWVFFLPVYIFFLMFGFIFIAAKNTTQQLVASQTLTSQALIFVNDIAFYVITLIFLAGGLIASFKFGGLAGSGASKLMGGIEKKVRQYIPGASLTRSAYQGTKQGVQQQLEKLQEKGIPLGGGYRYGGTQAETLRTAGVAEAFGVKGAKDKARAAEVDRETKKLKELNLTLDELNKRLTTASGPEKIAAFKLKLENGWLENTQAELDNFNKTLREVGGGRSVTGASLIASAKKGGWEEMGQSTVDKERIFAGLEDAEAKKAFGLDIANSREIMNTTLATQLLDLYRGDAKEVRDKVEKAVKDNIENMARKDSDRKDLLNGAGVYRGVDDRIKKLAGQVMVDKKEVDSWQERRRILDLNGGMDATGDGMTKEDKIMAKSIRDSNTIFKEEGDYRERNGIPPTVNLTPVQRLAVQHQIETNITSGFIHGLSTEEMKTPEIFNAINALGPTFIRPADSMKFQKQIRGDKPDRKKREAFDKAMAGPLMPY